MSTVKIPVKQQAEFYELSPEYVRISMAAAIELGMKPGKISRCGCDCINLLQNYPQGCASNCSYCGLARERPGLAEENSFIRVDWPLFPTHLVAQKIAEKEAQSSVGRVCIAQVQDHRAYKDLIVMANIVHEAAPDVPISALVSATTLNVERLHAINETGVDIIGVGIDAATEPLFEQTRGKLAKSPHRWDYHWEIMRASREIFGPMNVNAHIVVGLGETDRDLVDMFYQLKSEQIAGYLFSFNPEPGTEMEDVPRAPIQRLRRIQLVKYLIENHNLDKSAIAFNDVGDIIKLDAPDQKVDITVDTGMPFMTNGCPDRSGKVACNRPYGSYRPGEDYRDYPFQPNATDLLNIREQMKLQDIWEQVAQEETA